MPACQDIATKVMPVQNMVIVCLETAADFLGISNGGYNPSIQVYSEEPLGIPGIEVHINHNCFRDKQVIQKCGVYCTSPEQTLADLIDRHDLVDTQILLESLSYYYFTHNNSFMPLQEYLNKIQLASLELYKQDAIDYYDED